MDDTEQVIEVPKISSPPRPPFRSALADSRVSVLFQQLFAEQNIDIPVPGARGLLDGGGLQGSVPGQSSTASSQRGLHGSVPGQSSTTSSRGGLRGSVPGHSSTVSFSGSQVIKALFPNRVQQRFVEHITPVLKVSCWDRVHHRLVVLFSTTSRRRTWRKVWRRKKCWGGWSMSPSTASNTPPSAPDASAATSWLGAAGEDGAARQHEQELHPLSLPRADHKPTSAGVSALSRKNRNWIPLGDAFQVFWIGSTADTVHAPVLGSFGTFAHFLRDCGPRILRSILPVFGTESGADLWKVQIQDVFSSFSALKVARTTGRWP